MKQKQSLFVVTHIPSGQTFETMAVSESDAINHVHYKLWFGFREWTEMEDFEADRAEVLRIRRMLDDQRRDKAVRDYERSVEPVRNQNAEEYVQLSFSWV